MLYRIIEQNGAGLGVGLGVLGASAFPGPSWLLLRTQSKEETAIRECACLQETRGTIFPCRTTCHNIARRQPEGPPLGQGHQNNPK